MSNYDLHLEIFKNFYQTPRLGMDMSDGGGAGSDGGGSGAGGADSCVGNCGLPAPGGCYCDMDCSMYGDCCADACSACGAC